jgi:hypothetical protein
MGTYSTPSATLLHADCLNPAGIRVVDPAPGKGTARAVSSKAKTIGPSLRIFHSAF